MSELSKVDLYKHDIKNLVKRYQSVKGFEGKESERTLKGLLTRSFDLLDKSIPLLDENK